MSDKCIKKVRNTDIVVKPLKNAHKIVIKKDSKMMIINDEKTNKIYLKNLDMSKTIPLYKQDVIYESCKGDFLKGPPHTKLTITNCLNVIRNSSRTTAIIEHITQGTVIEERTSDEVVKLIGQRNYDTVFSALCAVINQESKVRGIMALLTEIKPKSSVKLEEKCCQTEENCMDLIFKFKRPKRQRRLGSITPYVIKDTPNKLRRVIVDPSSSETKKNKGTDSLVKEIIDMPIVNIETNHNDLPLIDLNEDSNFSTFSTLSNISNDMLLHNPKQLLKSIGQHTNNTFIKMLDGSYVMVPVKPEDKFHYATTETLRLVDEKDRRKLVMYQAYVDWKYCLERDSDGYLPIHTAVLNKDIDLLRRQCLMLKNRRESLDIIADNLTALMMSVFQDSLQCTTMLLQYGADPLVTDEEHKTALHIAAENSSEHLKAIVDYCRNNARVVFKNHSELWESKYDTYSDKELGSVLLDHICKESDEQGYTPLMLASKLGNFENVSILVKASFESINLGMPNSGNTALYLAVGEAHIDATNRGDTLSVAKNFEQTISFLLKNGADHTICNHAGVTIPYLLHEFLNPGLSTIITQGIQMSNNSKRLNIETGNLDPEPSNKKRKKINNNKNLKGFTCVDVNITWPKQMEEVAAKNKSTVGVKPVILENLVLTPTLKVNQEPKRKVTNDNDRLESELTSLDSDLLKKITIRTYKRNTLPTITRPSATWAKT